MKSRCNEWRRARPLLGTIVEITVRSNGMQGNLEAIDRAFATIAAVQQRMSFHDPKSMLSRINTHASARPVSVDEKTFQVLEIARDLYLLSDGLFDPTIAPELERAGFLPRVGAATAGQGTSFTDVELLSGDRVRFRRMGIRIDLGGVAKGFAVDEAVAVLRAAGFESGLVNAGGDLRVFGGQSFIVEIRDPLHLGKTLSPFRVRDLALATSAHYFAHRLKIGARIGPFVHPFLRRLQGDLLSVTVTASSAVLADALTKIVMLDPAKSLALLERFDAAALVFDPAGSTQCTPSWYETIQAAA